MTQKRTTALTTVIRKLRSREIILGALICAVLFSIVLVGCRKKPSAEEKVFSSKDALVQYAKNINCPNRMSGTHDDQIIVTDGSVHLGANVFYFPPGLDSNGSFVVSNGGKTLTSRKNSYVELVTVDNNIGPPRGIEFKNAHARVSMGYRGEEDFLTISTLETGDKLVLESKKPFKEWKPMPEADHARELIYDEDFLGGHTKTNLNSDTPEVPTKQWNANLGKISVWFVICVEN